MNLGFNPVLYDKSEVPVYRDFGREGLWDILKSFFMIS